MYEYAHAFPALLDVKQWLKFASHVHSSLTIGVDNQLLYLKDYIWSTSFFFFFCSCVYSSDCGRKINFVSGM